MVISKIESVKPSNYDDIKNKVAQVGYVQAVMDKLVEKINEKFVNQLNNTLTEERSKLEGLIKEVNHLSSLLEPPPMDAPEFI